MFYHLYLCSFCLSIAILSSCSGSVIKRIDEPLPLPPPPVAKGYLELPPGPEHTKIYLDHRYIGRYHDYPRETILLPVGDHLLRFSAKGYASMYAEVTIRRAKVVKLKTPLILAPSLGSFTE